MASISFWNRIEPSPRSDRLERHLSAQVRDPLWFLCRQYQFGEFRGEDAASPAFIEVNGRFSPITGWSAPGDAMTPFENRAPLEELVQTEGITPNWGMAVELGQQYETQLVDAGVPDTYIEALRLEFAVPPPSALPISERDHDLRRLLLICQGRGIDGLTLLDTILSATNDVPPAPPLPAGLDQATLGDLNRAFVAWVQHTYGDVSAEDAPAWQADRLEYRAQVAAKTADGGTVLLDAHPNRSGSFDWYAFDQNEASASRDDIGELADTAVTSFERSVLPSHVVFPGMPNKRWWHFEDSKHDFGELRASRLELGKILVLDFMLVHGNDWYVVPFAQDVGSLCRIDTLLVRDVFGEATLVSRADADPDTPWSLFTTSVGEAGRADYFILSPSATGASIQGDPIEEVRFIRDEMANLAWGIERSTESGVGLRWPGHERADQLGSEPRDYSPAGDDAPPLKYRFQTRVPEHWIPFVPVRREPSRRAVALQRAAALRIRDPGQPAERVRPLGRILNPSNLPDAPKYWIEEEEIPREGAEVRRRVERSRWIDGSTHFWIARDRRPGAGEGRSGLRFDQALEARKRNEN